MSSDEKVPGGGDSVQMSGPESAKGHSVQTSSPESAGGRLVQASTGPESANGRSVQTSSPESTKGRSVQTSSSGSSKGRSVQTSDLQRVDALKAELAGTSERLARLSASPPSSRGGPTRPSNGKSPPLHAPGTSHRPD